MAPISAGSVAGNVITLKLTAAFHRENHHLSVRTGLGWEAREPDLRRQRHRRAHVLRCRDRALGRGRAGRGSLNHLPLKPPGGLNDQNKEPRNIDWLKLCAPSCCRSSFRCPLLTLLPPLVIGRFSTRFILAIRLLAIRVRSDATHAFSSTPTFWELKDSDNKSANQQEFAAFSQCGSQLSVDVVQDRPRGVDGEHRLGDVE